MPDQVDWRALEREASPGRAVGRLLRDQREARGLSIVRRRESLRIRRPSSRGHRGGPLRPAAGRRLHPRLPARLRRACRARSREGADGLPSLRSGSDQASGRAAGRLPDRREARADRPRPCCTVLLVVGAGYAAWHYLPREQSVVAEKVPPVPDRLWHRVPRRRRQPTPLRPRLRRRHRATPTATRDDPRRDTATRSRRRRKPAPRRARCRPSLAGATTRLRGAAARLRLRPRRSRRRSSSLFRLRRRRPS